MKIITKEYLYELSGFLGHTIMVTFDPDSESAKIFSNQLIVKPIFTDVELDVINSNLKAEPIIETYGYVKAIEAGSYNLDARQAKLLEEKGFNVEDILNVSTDHLI